MQSEAVNRTGLDLSLTDRTQIGLSRAGAIFFVVFLAAAYVGSPNFGSNFDPARGPYGGDFLQEWIGGHMFLTGRADRLYDLAEARRLQHDPELVGYEWNEGRHLPMVYPPFYYALVSPLAVMPMKSAAIVWAALMVLALVAGIVLLHRTAGGQATRLACFLPLLAIYSPLVENLTTNQKGSVVLLLFAATFALLRSGRPFAAGMVFGLVAFKPQLALVIALAMLIKRQWRFVAGGATAGATLLAISLAVSDRACLDYLEFSRRTADYLHTAGYDLAKSHSWYGFFHLLLQGQSDDLIRIASGAMILATLIGLGILLRGPLRVESSLFAVQYSGLVLATILVSPHLLTYDLTLLVLPAALIAGQSLHRGDIPSSHVFLAILVGVVVLTISTPLARVVWLQISVPAMFAVLVALARYGSVLCEHRTSRGAPRLVLAEHPTG
jgi:hypothetical protein